MSFFSPNQAILRTFPFFSKKKTQDQRGPKISGGGGAAHSVPVVAVLVEIMTSSLAFSHVSRIPESHQILSG